MTIHRMKYFLAAFLFLAGCIGCNTIETNRIPDLPEAPVGPNKASVNQRVFFTTRTFDLNGDRVQFQFDWGDGRQSEWTPLVPSVARDSASHSYLNAGVYFVTVRTRDESGLVTDWSPPASITIIGSAILGRSDWFMFKRDLNHSGKTQLDGPATARIAWSFKTAQGINSSAAVAADGTILFGSDDFYLYAVYPNGDLKWRYNTSNWVRSSPAIDTNGVVYVASSNGILHAVNPDGSMRWNFSTSGVIELGSPVIGYNGDIYIGSGDGYLYALTPDGKEHWRYFTGGAVNSSPAVGNDGTIYVGSDSGLLFAMDPSGSMNWSFPTGAPIKSSPTIAGDGTVYFGCEDFYLYALSNTGNMLWRHNTSAPIYSSPSIGNDGTIYVGTINGDLFAITPTGQRKWYYDFALTGSESSPVITANGIIYFGSSTGFVYAVRDDGGLLWKYDIKAEIHASAAFGLDGTLFIGARDGRLYAFGM